MKKRVIQSIVLSMLGLFLIGCAVQEQPPNDQDITDGGVGGDTDGGMTGGEMTPEDSAQLDNLEQELEDIEGGLEDIDAQLDELQEGLDLGQ